MGKSAYFVKSTTPRAFSVSIYCANSLNLSNLIANYLVNFMYLVTNSFDKYLNRIGNSIAFIEIKLRLNLLVYKYDKGVCKKILLKMDETCQRLETLHHEYKKVTITLQTYNM